MGKLRVSDGIDLHYGGIQEGGAGLTDGSRNLTIATGASAGKFAVMNATVHGSYDFYNNGTSYFNGSVIVDESFNVTGSGRAIKMNGTTRINSDGHFITAGNLYFGATDSSLLAKDSANIKYMADGVHRFYTYNGSWIENTKIGDSGLNPLTNVYLTGGTDRRIKLGDSGVAGVSTTNNAVYVRGNDDHLILNCAGNGYISFTENGSEHMRLDTNGHLNVVSGDITMASKPVLGESSGTLIVGDASGNDQITTVDIKAYGGNGRLVIGDAEIFMYGNQNSNAEFKFTSNGILHCDNDVIAFSSTISSDRKLKENIQPIEGGLNKILKLKGVSFDWKDEKRDKNQLGFIAQEVEEVLPELVKEVETLGTEDEIHKVVNYDGVIPVLVEAIKMQQKQIDRLSKLLEKK